MSGTVDRQWFEGQVCLFEAIRPECEAYTQSLERILKHAALVVAPHALVQSRTKSIVSFAEKILRKGYREPLVQMIDLCGARVIVHTRAEAHAFSAWIKKHFRVEEVAEHDPAKHLRAREFWYRSVHHVVQFRNGIFPTEDVPVEPGALRRDLRAEVQVRTIAEHCWADVGHDRLYKSGFLVPARLEREYAQMAALLEAVDEACTRIADAVTAYQTGVAGDKSSAEAEHELEVLELVFSKDPGNAGLAHQIARLALRLGKWDRVTALVKDFARRPPHRLRLCAGIALCEQHKGDPGGPGHREGRAFLEDAVRADPEDVEGLMALADALAGAGEGGASAARQWYERAFEKDPANPRVLVGCVRGRIGQTKSASFLALLQPTLDAAIRRCRDQIEAEVNLPWAYFQLGELHLLRGQPYESLAAYARAVRSGAEFMFDAALAVVDQLDGASGLPEGADWVRRLLLLGKAVRADAGAPAHLAGLRSQDGPDFGGRVVIVAGGCDESVEARMQAYGTLLRSTFATFTGTILSGGTSAGISGLVGELAAESGGRIRAVAYLPEALPAGVAPHPAYECYTAGARDFTPLQPLQNWIDLLAAGVRATDVKLLGINGGRIAAFEYRLALALGARVGVVDDSGREANKLAADAEWWSIKGLVRLPVDAMTLWNFVEAPFPPFADVAQRREELARCLHDEHRRAKKAENISLAEWEELPPLYKESSLQLVDHIAVKLRYLGIEAFPAGDLRAGEPFTFTPEEEGTLAEMEHGRWNVERLLDGWTPGPRAEGKRRHPNLKAWQELSAEEKRYDYNLVRQLPGLLRQFGIGLRRRKAGKA